MYTNNKKNGRLASVLLVAVLLACVALPVGAQDAALSDLAIADDTLSVEFDEALAADTVAVDTIAVDPDPEWYVAPVEPVVCAAVPARAKAGAACPTDSVVTYDIDGNFAEVACYDYDDAGRVVCTTGWTYNAGKRIGTSKEEKAYDAKGTEIMTATYTWDNSANNWKGTEKKEFVYNSANKMESNTISDWVNGAWLPKTRYTYAYDASNREIEYYTFARGANNELVYSKARIREYNAKGKMTLEIQYTAYTNGAWSAGTKKMYDFDASGNQIEYTYYSALTNGNWGGSSSTHEVWTYTSGKKTYYEKQTWSNGWVNSSKETWEYNGPSAKQTYYEKNVWSNGAWIGSAKELWEFNAKGSQTLHEKYGWANGDWAISQQDNSVFDASNRNILVENYTYTNGVQKGSKKEEYTYYGTTTKKTSTIKYKWANNAWVENTKSVNDYDAAGNTTETAAYNWVNEAWQGAGTRTLQTFNSSKKVTEKITQTWSNTTNDWLNKTRTTTEYSGSKTIQEASYTWQNDAWVGTSRSDWSYNAAGQNDTIKTYTNNGTEWVYSNRTINTYNAKGVVIMTHKSTWNGSKWVLSSMTRTDEEYDAAGHLTLSASWKCGSDSVWIGIEKSVETYSATGKILFKAIYDAWANNDWVAYFKVEYEYDDADRLILEQRFDWNANAWKGNYRNEYGYDAQGRKNMEASYTGWDKTTGTWIGSSKTEQVFDANGKVISSISSVWGANTWRQVFRYTYTYDGSGREIERTVEHFEDDTWIYTEKYIKEYKGNTQITDNAYKWLNGQWVYSSRNEDYYDEDTQAKLRRKISGSWTNGILNSFTDNHYYYNCDPHAYVILFKNEDGTLLSSSEVNYGEMPEYTGATPTKPATAQYTYTFVGWDKAIVAVTGEATYTATFTQTLNKYTITFQNEDGSTIEAKEYEYGATPVAPADPTKEATAQYTYTFNGWDNTIVAVTGEATYKATFTATLNKYLITFQNEDGSVIEAKEYEYGTTPVAPADPTKDATAQYTYTFNGWDNTIVAVTGAATYKATFTSTLNKYLITFQNEDGSTIEAKEYEYGATPVAPADPTKEATAQYTYTFNGWDNTIVAVTGAATYKATFTATLNKYLITFQNEDGSTIEAKEYEYGATPVAPADPTKQATAQYTYTFNGWDNTIVAVTGEATYKATFTSTLNKYLITFQNEDGSVIEAKEYEYGATPVAPADPTKQATAQYTYTFSGWDKTIVAVTGEATYKATFTSTLNKYLITFQNEDGSVIEAKEYEYGATPVAPADPTKEATAQYTYTFNGWDNTIVAVTGEATYKATFTSTLNKYLITFQNEDGSVIEAKEYEYGTTPVAPADPTKEATAQYTYTFSGWDNTIVAVTGAATYKATFTSTLNKYLITFQNEDGSTIEAKEYEYGATPVAPADPTKDATAQYTYTFSGWDNTIVAVTGAATYKATFTATLNKYLITFQNEDGSTIEAKEYEYGATPVAPADPTKEATAQYTYTFNGWDNTIVAVTGVTTYKATFTATLNKYLITFQNEDGSVIEAKEYEYGATPVAPADPTKEATAQYTYTFSGWDNTIVAVTGAATYKATFTSTLNKYLITFQNEDGSVIETKEYEYGTTPVAPVDPTKDATAQYTYTFSGWDNTIVAVTGEATYKATFEATVNSYIITWVDEDGVTVLYEGEFEYGSMPEYGGADPAKEATAEYTYSFAGWTPEVVEVVGTATYTATYTATIFTGLDNTIGDQAAVKVVENGIVYIVRAGKKYAITGVAVE